VLALFRTKYDQTDYVLESEGPTKITLLIEPHLYRDLNNECSKYTQLGKVSLEVVDQQVHRVLHKTEPEKATTEGGKREEIKEEEKKVEEEAPKAKKMPFQCTKCKDAGFLSNQEYKEHFKSDWHVENVRRHMEKLPILDSEQF